ncbi:MAG: hypothetical protein GY746_00185, partial [Gammaproteobacteria bacterium]|nr:hypothetical protein [Gammaproteobacteria bacterium]
LHLKGNGQNNVKSWDIKYSYTTRYNKYACNSQDSFGQDPLADSSGDGTSRAAYVTDSTIRAGRFLEIKAEESMTDAQCSKRANEEANLRRARSTVYTAIVAGTQQADGSNWNLGDLVTVQDDFAGLKGEYLIRALEYSISVSGGSNTRITIAPVDAYTVVGTKTTGSKRKSADGEEMVNPVAKLVSKYTRVVQKEVSIEDREILRRKKILGIK